MEGRHAALPSRGTGVPPPDSVSQGAVRNKLTAAPGAGGPPSQQRVLLWGAVQEQESEVPKAGDRTLAVSPCQGTLPTRAD